MKTKRILFMIMVIGTTFSSFGQSNGKDKTVIFKETIDGGLQTIFIDNNKDSKYYDEISQFNFELFDNQSYKISTDYLKEHNLTLKKVKPVIPWRNWVTLEQYKGKLYVYRPCDFLFHFRQSVNDSTFIDWTGEGPVANKIMEQKKIDSKTYEYKLKGIYEQERIIVIHIIDNKNGIAVFEETTNKTETKYYLMIAADKIKNVPIIVNYCPTEKQSELEFDTPDFKKLLMNK